ncbi:MAG TPA: hypothetical protein VK986_10785 [Tepidisphaeraceae bacterium]|nr:hypothetical protein [Tepidisphaeraceae bacterium]
MWMSNVLIMVNRNNVDHNGLADVAAAVADCGARVIEVDEGAFAIEANVATREVPTITAMEGVVYVRSVFNYFCDAAAEMEEPVAA